MCWAKENSGLGGCDVSERGDTLFMCHPCNASHLPCDALDISKRDTLIVGADDELEKVVPQHLKHHAHMSPIHSTDLEVIQQLNRLVSLWIILVGLSNLSGEARNSDCAIP